MFTLASSSCSLYLSLIPSLIESFLQHLDAECILEIAKTTIYGQGKRSLRKISNVKSARSISLTSVRVKFINNSNWNLAKDWFWRQNARERPWLLSQREERERGAKWRMVLFGRGSLSRKLKSENDNCPLIYYLRLCKQLGDKWITQLIHQEEYLMPHISSLQRASSS